MKTWHALIIVFFPVIVFDSFLSIFFLCLSQPLCFSSQFESESFSESSGAQWTFFLNQVLSQATERETFSFHYSAWAALYCPRVVPNGHNTLRPCYEGMHGASQQDTIQRTGQTRKKRETVPSPSMQDYIQWGKTRAHVSFFIFRHLCCRILL